MFEFFSTCPAGLEIPAARLLSRECGAARDVKTAGGCVFYALPGPRAPMCPAFQNTYLVLARVRAENAREAGTRFAKNARALAYAAQMVRAQGFGCFRVMFSNENTLCAPDPAARQTIERAISCARVDRVNPDTEILILRRSEGYALLLLRLTRREDTRRTLSKGALSPGVCACMIALSRPQKADVFLDPFAGSGALALMRQRLAPCAAILASDNATGAALAQALARVPRAKALGEDALRMPEWARRESVTSLVTDPPWGLFTPLLADADAFSSQMLQNFAYVCAPGARAVVLTAAKDAFSRALAQNGAFRPLEKFDCLIHGKKACVFVMEKRAGRQTEEENP